MTTQRKKESVESEVQAKGTSMSQQLTIFDELCDKFSITKPIRLIELFAGYGSQAMALKRAGAKFEHYKEDLKGILLFHFDSPRAVLKLIREKFGCQIKLEYGEHPTSAILEWMLQPYKEQILGEAEREYLSSVIKPYKNKVTGITKVKDEYKENMRYIRITVRSVGTEYINLPWFKENTMYKGMKDLKDYTLEELGL